MNLNEEIVLKAWPKKAIHARAQLAAIRRMGGTVYIPAEDDYVTAKNELRKELRKGI